jgi:hypothetical protein
MALSKAFFLFLLGLLVSIAQRSEPRSFAVQNPVGLPPKN